jgi:hypothetical protein
MECCPLPTKARFLRLCNRAPSGRQTSRPASACRLLLIHTSSNSSAYLSSVVHLDLHRRARLLHRVSFTTYALRRRPTVQSVATPSRASSTKTTIATTAFVGSLSSAYSCTVCATFICPLDVAIVAANKAGQNLHPYAIAHSSPACAAHHPTLVNPEGNL